MTTQAPKITPPADVTFVERWPDSGQWPSHRGPHVPSSPQSEHVTAPTEWADFRRGEAVHVEHFVREAAKLLRIVIAWTDGQGTDSLIDGLVSSYSTVGRESVLRLDEGAESRSAVTEFAHQAQRVNDHIVGLVRAEFSGADLSTPGRVLLRSHCDGHLWTRPVAGLLTGPSGGAEAMQAYNEWLHQMVLLRDALLVFENFEDVPILVGSDGLRRLEGPREQLVTELTIRKPRHQALVDFARLVVRDINGAPGYGFAFTGGAVLPQVVKGNVWDASPHLLSWLTMDEAQIAGEVTFAYAESDYFDAPRAAPTKTVAHATKAPGKPSSLLARLGEISPHGDQLATLALAITDPDGVSIGVDVGQAVRGHRFAYRTGSDSGSAPLTDAQTLSVWDLIRTEPMTWARDGVYAVDAAHHPDLALALLGKIYPENVILCSGAATQAALEIGKTGPARFVLVNSGSAHDEPWDRQV